MLAGVDLDDLDSVLGAWSTAAAGDLVRAASIAVDVESAHVLRRGARDGSRLRLFAAITRGIAIHIDRVHGPAARACLESTRAGMPWRYLKLSPISRGWR